MGARLQGLPRTCMRVSSVALLRRKGQGDSTSEPTPKRQAPNREAHAELVERATRWARGRCTYAVPEIVTLGGETPDVYGYGYQCSSLIVECKASRSDFLRDAKKMFRRKPAFGIGHRRFYMCPPGLISLEELPELWGLLYCHPRKIEVVREALPQPYSVQKELWLTASILRRVLDRKSVV